MSTDHEVILKDFRDKTDLDFSNIQDLLNHLSEEFASKCEDLDDAQEVYNDLDKEHGFLIGKYFVYSLSETGETWTVSEGDEFKESELPEYIQSFSDYYSRTDIQSLDDLTSAIENRVMKDMSNVGCDPKTALNLLLSDLDLDGKFRISGADAEPKIEMLN